MTYGTPCKETLELLKEIDNGAPIDFDNVEDEEYLSETVRVSVVFDGALDEEFPVLAWYAQDVVDVLFEHLRESHPADEIDVDAYTEHPDSPEYVYGRTTAR